MAYMGDVCTGRKYKDQQGQDKTKYTKIGAWFENDQGQLSIKLDALPMPDDDLITTTAPSRIVGHRATTLTVTPSHVGSASRCWGCGLPCTSDYCWSCQRGGSR